MKNHLKVKERMKMEIYSIFKNQLKKFFELENMMKSKNQIWLEYIESIPVSMLRQASESYLEVKFTEFVLEVFKNSNSKASL